MARLDRKPAERVATAGFIVQILIGGLAFLLWKLSGAATVWVFAWQALIGALIWIVALVHLRQSRLADEETEEWERLQAERAAGGARGRLFEEDEIQAFAARNRLRIFEKYVAPAMSVLLAILLAALVVVTLLLGVVQESQVRASKAVLVTIFSVAGAGFIFFLIAMYAAGMSRQAEWRPLRASSSYMMFSALFALGATVGLSLGYFGFTKPDRVLAYCMLALAGIVTLEVLLNFVLDFYRPRVEGVETRMAYDSRLLGLLAQPGGILRTVSATLDYQFGFRVSQTWFYRFIESAIAPLLLFQILTLYLLTCFVIVGPEQGGVVERFGKYRGILSPGLHFKLPWPFERVYRFPAREVRTIYLGHTGEKETTDKILWTVKHYDKEYEVMVATRETGPTQDVPVNLLVATTSVRYRIKDVEKWYYRCASPDRLLEALCEREQIKYLAGADLFDIMGVNRQKASEDLRNLMQAVADAEELGVEILGVGMEGIHPPVTEGIPEAFHELVSALTQREIDVLEAERKAIETVGTAEGQAEIEKAKARSYYESRVSGAKAEADRFTIQNKFYATAAEVFKTREFLSALEKGLENARKYVVGVSNLDKEVVRLNLEDPAKLGIEDIPEFDKPIMPEEDKKKK